MRLWLVLLLGWVSLANANEIVIENSLARCIEISADQQLVERGHTLLATHWKTKNTIGDCGCKSALMSYRVFLQNSQRQITHGFVSSLNKSGYAFLINPDKNLFGSTTLRLAIGCANSF